MKQLMMVLMVFWCSAVTASVDKNLGPSPLLHSDNNLNVGRIAAMALSPTDANVMFAGAADGGVWKTTDGGAHWRFVSQGIPTTSIGSLVIDPNDEQVIYAGTGESNYANHSRYGLGLYRSINGGESWELLNAAVFQGRSISKLAINPNDSQTIYAAVTHAGGFPERVAAKKHPNAYGQLGMFKSTDGGFNWQHLTGLPNLSVSSFQMHPDNPRNLIAAVGRIFGSQQNGIYETTDSGMTWQKRALPLGSNPDSVLGRGTVAVSKSNPNVWYAVYSQAVGLSRGAIMKGMYRSTNGGETWTQRATNDAYPGYGWYFSALHVDEDDPDTVYVGGVPLYVSHDGGMSWDDITTPHVDIHVIQQDSDGRLVVGDDGGVHRSATGGLSWETLNNGISNVQFYAGLTVNLDDGITLIGGAQDNGTNRSKKLDKQWNNLLGGDGGWTQYDPNTGKYYLQFQGVGNLYSLNQGQVTALDPGGQLNGPVAFYGMYVADQNTGDRLLYGTDRIHESLDGGLTWRVISSQLTNSFSAGIRSMVMSATDSNYVYLVTNDGNVQRSKDSGKTFILVRGNVPGWPRITREITVHPDDPEKVYLAVSAFGEDQVLFSDNAGDDWQVLDGDLPDVPVNTVTVVPYASGDHLYAGTDQGLYLSTDGGVNWRLYGKDIPMVPVIDVIHKKGQLFVATQGTGLWVVEANKGAENSSFPSDFLHHAWFNPEVDHQGMMTQVLSNLSGDVNERLDVSVLFTNTPQSQPIWLYAQGAIPTQADSYQMPILMPTGDIEGQPMVGVGVMTKNRVRDDQGQLVNAALNVSFDFSQGVKDTLSDMLAGSNFYNEAAFDGSPFSGMSKEIALSQLTGVGQSLSSYCGINAHALITAGEVNEGRLNYIFPLAADASGLFGADFTYQKTVDAQGDEQYELDGGLATPYWYVYDNISESLGGFNNDGSSNNVTFKPQQAGGFFENISGQGNAVETLGFDETTVQNGQLAVDKSNGGFELMSKMAPLSRCRAFLEL